MRCAWTCLVLLAAVGCRSTGSGEGQGQYVVVFSGNEAFDDGDLRAVVSTSLKDFVPSGFQRSYVDDAAYDLELYYRGRGFQESTVDYEVTEADPPVFVTFEIHEGPRTKVAAARFQGNRLFSSDELRSFLGGSNGWLSSKDLYYEESSARAARAEIVAAYEARGYLDVRVELLEPQFSADRTSVELSYVIEEGPEYLLGTVDVTGDGLDREDWRKLVAELAQTTGRTYSHRVPFRMKSRLLEALGAAGYPDAQVRIDRERTLADVARVNIRLDVKRGQLVTLAGIRLEGRQEVDESFLLDLLRLDVGQPVDMAAIRAGLARIYGTGLFKRVGQELVAVEPGEPGEPEEPGLRELVVSLEESTPTEFFVEPGLGSYVGLRLRAGARKRNLFGRAQDLTVEGLISQRDVNASVQLINPKFLGRDLKAGVSLVAGMRQEPTFLSREVGAGVFLTRQLDGQSSVAVGYQLRSSDASNVSASSGSVDDSLDISSVRADYRYDSRRSLLRTSGGVYGFAGVEVGNELLHSDLDFIRFRGQIAAFLRLAESTVLGLQYRLGWIRATSSGGVPIQEQFFNGGQNSVRSFRRSELARNSVGQVIGGEVANTLSVELRRRMVGELEGALFVDFGNVSLDAGAPFDDEFTGAGYGVGLRYLLPIGALRIDLGVNPDPGSFDESYVIHFAVGNPF